ncbi:MAG: glycosyltransferase [Sphingomonas sp.]|uniref:glycosyltransferase family 2 protein n=1 Tax=Sphingomonas sp. TaxID=28214 RepID=UPI001B0300AC|nr:glycosyltransferase family 2 protein [Sphingomonas sp.]MBO9623887.1 glycosyltransferase [Sphingomonas sp.]
MDWLAPWLLCGVVALPITVLAIECLIGTRALRDTGEPLALPPFTVVMPAHDEALGIREVADAVAADLCEGDALVVVADNCTDDTAAIANEAGATVLVRTDPENRGKGHALEFGRRFIAAAPSGIVIIVDADCRPAPGALRRLAAVAFRHDAVVQGAYLLEPAIDARPNVRVSCLAFLVKNLVRQRALQRLAGAALLQGSGMAFPSRIFNSVQWDTACLVEDLELGIRLLASGERVLFDDRARFSSAASSERATANQRRRWEHGMLQSMFGLAWRLAPAVFKHDWRLVFVALDLLIPPTAVLVAMGLGVTAMASVLLGPHPAVVSLIAAQLLLAFGLVRAWRAHGRALLPAGSLAHVLRYALWKLPIAARFLVGREREWVRTEREL